MWTFWSLAHSHLIPVRSVTGCWWSSRRALHPLWLPYGPSVFAELSPRGRDAIPQAFSVRHAPYHRGGYTDVPASGPTRPSPAGHPSSQGGGVESTQRRAVD